MAHEENDAPTPESMPVVRREPGAAADQMDGQRGKPIPAIVEADEREEAGYGYGV